MASLLASFPAILAGADFKAVVAAIRSARTGDRGIIWGFGAHVIKTGLGPILIDLMEFRTPANEPVLAPTGAVGSTHFALAVENLSEVYERLRGQGVEFVSEPVTFDLTEGSVTVVFTRDPDGNVVELVDLQEG